MATQTTREDVSDVAQYPTKEEVTRGLTAEDMEKEIENLASWAKSGPVLAEVNLTRDHYSADIISAWALLAKAIHMYVPTAVIEGFKITRPLSPAELREAAVTAIQSRVYSERVAAENESGSKRR